VLGVTVDVHQVVHDAHTDEFLSNSNVRHSYHHEDGLIVRMNVVEEEAMANDGW
jgi:hypothetical protein